MTSVGGTTHIPEVAVSRFFSGGGFSDYVRTPYFATVSLVSYAWQFKRPSYQDAAVKKYLGNLPKGTYEGLFNP